MTIRVIPDIFRSSLRTLGRAAIAAVAGTWLLGAGPAAAEEVKVRVGVLGSLSDGTFYIAQERGYFQQEGLNVEFIPFKTTAQQVAPLGAGQLEVGGGAPSAGLYNLVARGVDIRIVADRGSMPPGYGYMPLLVRKELIDTGRFTGFKDLKGMTVGTQSKGGAALATLNEALRQGGLTMRDVNVVYMGHADLALALENGAIGAAFITEPNATQAMMRGAAVRYARGDEVYPDQQLATLLYGGKFAREMPEAAKRFMRAYVRASRDYNDALRNGAFAGPAADGIIAILTKYTELKDPAAYKGVIPQGVHPDGAVNVDSLRKDLEFLKAEGLLNGEVRLETVLDDTFAKAAVRDLGPYTPKN